MKNLQDAVESLDVADAILIYRLLIAQNVTVPDDLKQSLLELVCFYNHNDPIPFDKFEERSAKEAIQRSRDGKVEVWNENCFANELFQSIEPKTSAAYNTMIRALYKYNSRDRGEELYNEAVQNGITIDLATHNAYLQNISKPGVTVEMRWEQIRKILSDINKQQLKPDVHTLNAILHTIKSAGNIHTIGNYASHLMAEFKKLNVEPSLATYSRLLDIYHGKMSSASNAIYQIVEQIEKNPDLKAQTVDDFSFFYKAMVVCRFRLNDPASLVRRIDNILTHSDNIKFLGDAQLEQFYYRYFLSTILHNEPFPSFLRTYNQLVPETYSLEPSVADDIFSAINLSGSIQFIPKFWSDMIISGISRRNQLNDTLLALMTTNQPDPELKEHEGLAEQFADIAWLMYQNTMNEQFASARKEEIIPATRLSLIVILLIRSNRHANARTIVESCVLEQKQNRIVGAMTAEALSEFINSCVENKEPNIAIQCVAYSIENGVGDPIQLGRKIVESFTLPPHEVKRITDLVGQDVLKSVQKASQ